MDQTPQYPSQREELLKQYNEGSEKEVGFIRSIDEANPFSPLTTGENVPSFTLNDHNGQPRSFQSLLAKGPVVLSFNRGNWCGFCQMEINTWVSFLNDLSFYGASFVSISADVTWRSHFLKTMEPDTNMVLLEDKAFEVANLFGLRYKLTEEYANAFEGFGLDLNDFYGEPADDTKHSLPVPATYVIDSKGRIIYDYFNTDYTQRVEPYEVIKVLIQHSRKNQSS